MSESGPRSLWLLENFYGLCKRISSYFQNQAALKLTYNLRSESPERSLARPDSWVRPADRWASECLISYCASWIGFWCESIGYGTETIEKSPFFSPFRHKKLWRWPQKGFVLPLWKLVSNSVDFLVFQKRWVKLMNLMNSPRHKRHRFGIWTFPKADGQVSKLFQEVCTQMWQCLEWGALQRTPSDKFVQSVAPLGYCSSILKQFLFHSPTHSLTTKVEECDHIFTKFSHTHAKRPAESRPGRALSLSTPTPCLYLYLQSPYCPVLHLRCVSLGREGRREG